MTPEAEKAAQQLPAPQPTWCRYGGKVWLSIGGGIIVLPEDAAPPFTEDPPPQVVQDDEAPDRWKIQLPPWQPMVPIIWWLL